MMHPEHFVSALCALSFENAFNPYANCCPVHDKVDAPSKRAKALARILGAATRIEVDSIWIGRDLGYRGGRRTGLALTDDVHMTTHAARWGVRLERPTNGQPVAERTAAVIWALLRKIDAPIFLWNVFPLHPHEPDDPFTNRPHSARERIAGEDILFELILLLRPRRIVAIGNDASRSVARVAPDKNTVQVRHPSYGGQNDFLMQMATVYPYRTGQLL
jgi:hypothetical protein